MIMKRYFVEGLAHASYMVGSEGQAVVIDPKRDVEDYIRDAEKEGMRIVAVLNTHPHADFASGFRELAERVGADVYVSHLAPVSYPHIPGKDGDVIELGKLKFEILETPGHSPDSLSFLVKKEGKAMSVFTGDLLFVNDVGRPDLRDADEDPRGLADKLYDSLFGKILSLPEEVQIYPAHGAGSLCGRAISSEASSTVGNEKANNWAAQIENREEFVDAMVSNLPARPAYFSYDVDINLNGATSFNQAESVPALSELEIRNMQEKGAVVIDTRKASDFGAGHIGGSFNIGLGSSLFSTWVGFLVSSSAPIVLVLNRAEDLLKARTDLARIGYDSLVGYIEGRSLGSCEQLSQLSVCDLRSALNEDSNMTVIDVRTSGEWNAGHIENATHVPLPELSSRIEDFRNHTSIAVICGSGYRSSIAASVLLRSGVSNVQNVMGGMGAFMDVNCPMMNPAELVFGEGKACSLA